MNRHGAALWAICLLATSAQAQQDDPCLRDPDCLADRGQGLVLAGQVREAIDLLKEHLPQHPDSPALTLALAGAYLKDDNVFWALRVLRSFHASHPEDCEVRSWLVWVQAQRGELAEAREMLRAEGCPQQGPLKGRWPLLAAWLDTAEEHPQQAMEAIKLAMASERLYREDQELLAYFIARTDPGRLPPLSWRIELSGGWTSNALLGSPTDAAGTGQAAGSPVGLADLWMRFIVPASRYIQPSIEGRVRALGLTSSTVDRLSYLDLSYRPGVWLGHGYPRFFLGYGGDTLLLAGGDEYGSGPIWFYEGHRGEVEVEVLPALTVFAGGGRRYFRETGRTRYEVDGGLGGSVSLTGWLSLMAALSARYHHADNEAYTLVGGSAVASLRFLLPHSFSVRAGAIAGVDYFPHSEGYFVEDQTRQEVMMKFSLSLWAPEIFHTRLGATYEFSDRISSADTYSFMDHRVLLKLAWTGQADPWLPGEADGEGHISLGYGIQGQAGGQEERIQDLLRQDEAARRGSSCVE